MGEVLSELEGYTIYRCNNKIAGDYYFCVPTNKVTKYQLFITFPEVDMGKLSNEEAVLEVRKVGDSVFANNKNALVVLPDIAISLLEKATLENDDRKYNKILNEKIQPITAEIFQLITKAVGGVK